MTEKAWWEPLGERSYDMLRARVWVSLYWIAGGAVIGVFMGALPAGLTFTTWVVGCAGIGFLAWFAVGLGLGVVAISAMCFDLALLAVRKCRAVLSSR